jgi:hypothetical protein
MQGKYSNVKIRENDATQRVGIASDDKPEIGSEVIGTICVLNNKENHYRVHPFCRTLGQHKGY